MKKILQKISSALRRAFSPPPILALGNTTTNSSGYRTFQATAVAIAEGIRVTVDSNGLISAAAANVGAIGVTTEPVAASGYGTVKLWNAGGTFIIQAHATGIAKGAILYPAAAGRIDDSGTTAIPLVALEASTAQGDMIECAPWYLGA
jgi:hypothetical protein